MSRVKFLHMMRHYAAWCRQAVRDDGQFVSAGQVARLTGSSVSTARLWLNRAVEEGELEIENRRHTNGIQFVAYGRRDILEQNEGKK